jgi:hypothetical protein
MRKITREIPEINNIESFLSRIKINKESECWEWAGAFSTQRYGQFYIKSKAFYAHRISFSIFKKEKLSTDLMVDHVCMNRKCVNPDHLRQVTLEQNLVENSNTCCAKNKRKTHCKRGHELSGYNLMLIKYGRACRICNYDLSKKSRERKKNNGQTV